MQRARAQCQNLARHNKRTLMALRNLEAQIMSMGSAPERIFWKEGIFPWISIPSSRNGWQQRKSVCKNIHFSGKPNTNERGCLAWKKLHEALRRRRRIFSDATKYLKLMTQVIIASIKIMCVKFAMVEEPQMNGRHHASLHWQNPSSNQKPVEIPPHRHSAQSTPSSRD